MVNLPHDKEEKTIATMFPGETGYTVPWALVVDKDRACWIRGDFHIGTEQGGTSQMKVHRNTKGYCVEVPEDYMYLCEDVSELHHTDWQLNPIVEAKW